MQLSPELQSKRVFKFTFEELLTFYFARSVLKLVFIVANKSDNLVAKISSIEVSPTGRFWHKAPIT
jgi:hypothetical protein